MGFPWPKKMAGIRVALMFAPLCVARPRSAARARERQALRAVLGRCAVVLVAHHAVGAAVSLDAGRGEAQLERRAAELRGTREHELASDQSGERLALPIVDHERVRSRDRDA